MSKNYHNELNEFVFDLVDRSIYQENSLDDIWRKIISDARDYDERDRYKWYDGDFPVQHYSFEKTERPDIIYSCDEFIMGIECFSFDASKKPRKGSKQEQIEHKVEREMQEEYRHSTPPVDSFLSIEKTVDVEFSIKNYCVSLVSAFNSHVNSINDYRQKLSAKASGKNVFLSFFIEDTTAIGNYVITNGKSEALDPLKIPFFLKYIASMQGLDYVIIKTTNLYVPSLRFQKISHSLIIELLNKCYGINTKYVPYQYKKVSHYWGLGDENA